jgi:hypothetical protein
VSTAPLVRELLAKKILVRLTVADRPGPVRDPVRLTARTFAGCGRPSHSTSHSNLSSAAHREMVKGLQRSQESERAKQGDPTVALVRSRN